MLRSKQISYISAFLLSIKSFLLDELKYVASPHT